MDSSYQKFKWYRKPPVGTRLNPQHNLAKGLVNYFTLGERAGQFVYNIGRDQNKGTLIGGTARAVGKFGNVLRFDGVDDYVDLDSLNIGKNEGTISLWLNAASLSALIVAFYFYNADTQDHAIFGWLSGSNVLLWSVNNTGNDAARNKQSTANAITANTWYHIVVTKTVSGGIATSEKIYVNAVDVTAATTTHWGTNNTEAIIGTSWNTVGGVAFWNGMIDEFRIYNRILAPGEIRELYSNPFADFQPPQSRRWWDTGVTSPPSDPFIGNDFLQIMGAGT